jgi:transposase-like protein
MTPVNTAGFGNAALAQPKSKSDVAQTFDAGSLTCPRCSAGAARRAEQTEWIVFYRCCECQWTFATRI